MGSEDVSHPFHEDVSQPFWARNDTDEMSVYRYGDSGKSVKLILFGNIH